MPDEKMDDNFKMLKDAQDTMCIITGKPYDTILKIQKDFKESGIEASITTGGLQVYANHKTKAVKRICLKHKTIPEPGVSRYVENTILNHKKTPFPKLCPHCHR